MSKFKVIDLFAGCGGLSCGFKKDFELIASLEIDKTCCETLNSNSNPEELIINEDINNFQNYLPILDSKINGNLDGVIGGPPCQAYSIAGRINPNNKMDKDPRNFLFESFIEIIKRYNPKFFIFENVQGIISSKPHGIDLKNKILTEFNKIGFSTMEKLEECVFDMSEYSVPQKRKRVILFGLNNRRVNDSPKLVKEFYENLKKSKSETKTVKDAINDLPKIFPKEKNARGRRDGSHFSTIKYPEHNPRFHNDRDINIFELLAEDIQSKTFKYTNSENLKNLYTEKTGKTSKVHKYHVLRWDKPSNTIPAHLHKDGLRHIHPDPKQARTLTVREAARLMTFDDRYILNGSIGQKYKMLGNAVPPLFAEKLSKNIIKILKK